MPTTRLRQRFGSSAWGNTSCAFSMCFPRHPALCMDLGNKDQGQAGPGKAKGDFPEKGRAGSLSRLPPCPC